MRAVIQRVRKASVSVKGDTVAEINSGLVVLLGIETTDSKADLDWLAGKIVSQRLFSSGDQPWAHSVKEMGGELLLVSQFTLHASTRKGTKPSWHRAAKPEQAQSLFQEMTLRLKELLGRDIATGRFGAMMDVSLVNDGPVTLIIDSKDRE
jgi:D-tyrosyl-tRNA(Tyr) deacylase